MSDQDSPVALLEKMHFAILRNDHKAFVECYRFPEGAEALLGRCCDLLSERYIFVGKVEDAYGKEEVARFVDFRTMRMPGMVTISAPPLHERWWEKVEIKISGDQAKFTDPTAGLFSNRKMVRSNNIWRVEFDLPQPYDDCARTFGVLLDVLKTVEPEIGQPGVTIDDLRLKLGQLQSAKGL